MHYMYYIPYLTYNVFGGTLNPAQPNLYLMATIWQLENTDIELNEICC